MKRYLESMNLRHKFFTWSSLILIAFSLVLSIFYYQHLKSILMQEALDKSEVILQEVEAIRDYVKEELRPRMYDLHPDDTFIIEAMSTTYISLSIMRRFAEKMDGYVFRRASLNPHNPSNLADEFEEEMFDWFEEDRQRNFWQGIVSRNDGKSYFVSMVPDYFEENCLRCHGDYRDAPQELVDRYGPKNGFRFKNGDMAGINSVSIPVSTSLKQIRRDSVIVFLVILASSASILFLINLLFDRLVINRLARVTSSLLRSSDSIDHKDIRLPGPREFDELDMLRKSFKALNRYVQTARKGSEVQPNFMGPYLIGEPLAAGTLSWLYHARDSRDSRQVSIKLGFDEMLTNSLYAACYRSELRLMQLVQHDCLLRPVEQLQDMLILEPAPGTDFDQWIDTVRSYDRKAILPILEQICDLTATLHSMGLIHHDLRPSNFLINPDDHSLKLIDMGLASLRDTPDTILSSGLGPQGDFRYMAPEQMQGIRGDSRSDIYTVGILLYRLCTGQLPFKKQRSSLKKWLRIKGRIEPPSTYRGDLSNTIDAIILKATAWDIDKRYQWIEDLWEDMLRELT